MKIIAFAQGSRSAPKSPERRRDWHAAKLITRRMLDLVPVPGQQLGRTLRPRRNRFEELVKDPHKQRILVTGGAGVICPHLLAEQHEVLCVDNFFTGTKGNVAHLLNDPYFEVVRHDITVPLYIEVDQIFNLACPASPIYDSSWQLSEWSSAASTCGRRPGPLPAGSR